MAVYLRDIGNNALDVEAFACQTVTQTSTGAACNMLSGDGRVNCRVQISTLTGTSITVQVQQSTTTSGTYTNISGAVGTFSAVGIGYFTFDRPQSNPYLKAAVTINGTTATMAAGFIEQLKIF